jgi:hypothetical protein
MDNFSINSIDTAANETITELLTCAWCSNILEKPVILPCCFETICGEHESEFRKAGLECKLCNTPTKLESWSHFSANRIVQSLLDRKVTELDLGCNHTKAAEGLKELSKFVDQFEQLKTSGADTIYEFFCKQRNKVDLAREELISNLIAKSSDELLDELDSYENECELNSLNLNNSIESFSDDLVLIKSNIAKWETEIKQLIVDDELWVSMRKQIELNLAQLKAKYKEKENRMFICKSNKDEIESNFSNVWDRFGRILGFSWFLY